MHRRESQRTYGCGREELELWELHLCCADPNRFPEELCYTLPLPSIRRIPFQVSKLRITVYT